MMISSNPTKIHLSFSISEPHSDIFHGKSTMDPSERTRKTVISNTSTSGTMNITLTRMSHQIAKKIQVTNIFPHISPPPPDTRRTPLADMVAPTTQTYYYVLMRLDKSTTQPRVQKENVLGNAYSQEVNVQQNARSSPHEHFCISAKMLVRPLQNARSGTKLQESYSLFQERVPCLSPVGGVSLPPERWSWGPRPTTEDPPPRPRCSCNSSSFSGSVGCLRKCKKSNSLRYSVFVKCRERAGACKWSE